MCSVLLTRKTLEPFRLDGEEGGGGVVTWGRGSRGTTKKLKKRGVQTGTVRKLLLKENYSVSITRYYGQNTRQDPRRSCRNHRFV